MKDEESELFVMYGIYEHEHEHYALYEIQNIRTHT